MKDHRKWTGVFTYCKDIPLNPIFVKKVNDLIKEDKNVIIFLKQEDHNLNPKYTPGEKFKAICAEFNDQISINKTIISTVTDINEIIELEE